MNNISIQEKIFSKDNEKIKFLRKLTQKKHREKYGKFFVENLSIIYDAARTGVCFDSLFATESFVKKNKEKFETILDNLKIAKYFLITPEVNQSFSELDNPSGICAVYSKRLEEINFDNHIVYLDDINDPGNLGTILRSAIAFDLKNIVIGENCADVYNNKTIQAAKDAIFKINLSFDKNLEILKTIKKQMPIFSSRLQESDGLEVFKKQKKFCLVLGSESHGVNKKIQDLSSGFVKIKISKNIESLNVASAAAIMFYKIFSDMDTAL